jgi:hypothetical protein
VESVDTRGILVLLGRGVRGLVTPMHFADVLLKTQKVCIMSSLARYTPLCGCGADCVVLNLLYHHRHRSSPSVTAVVAVVVAPQLKTKVGDALQVRVLTVHAGQQRCLLTHKKTLLTTTLPLITSYEAAAAGAPTLVSHGFVTGVLPARGIIVTFYDNVHGLVSEEELTRAVSAARRSTACRIARACRGTVRLLTSHRSRCSVARRAWAPSSRARAWSDRLSRLASCPRTSVALACSCRWC